MAQFTVYRNKNPRTRSTLPFLLDVQSDFLEDLETRVVVPLCRTTAVPGRPLRTLTPVLEIEGESFLMLTPQLAGTSKSDVGAPIAHLEGERFAIIAAIDFLITGV